MWASNENNRTYRWDSWESSLLYYQIINERVKERKGGHHSAKSLLYSVDFQEIKDLQHQTNWTAATKIMIESAQKLEAGGADVYDFMPRLPLILR